MEVAAVAKREPRCQWWCTLTVRELCSPLSYTSDLVVRHISRNTYFPESFHAGRSDNASCISPLNPFSLIIYKSMPRIWMSEASRDLAALPNAFYSMLAITSLKKKICAATYHTFLSMDIKIKKAPLISIVAAMLQK